MLSNQIALSIYRIKFHRDIYKDLDVLGKAVGNGDEGSSLLDMFSLEMFENIAYIMAKHADPTIPDSLHLSRLGQKKFIFFCTYSIKPLLIFKVQNSLLLLTFSLLPIEEASSFFTTGFLYYLFCLLHCFGDKTLL